MVIVSVVPLLITTLGLAGLLVIFGATGVREEKRRGKRGGGKRE